MKIIAYLCLFLTSLSAHAIVTVENLSLSSSNLGLNRQINIDINGSSGNTEKSDWRTGADLVWRAPKYINHLVLSYEYGESNQEANTNNSFIHARHIHQHNNTFDLEYFAQVEKDEFARLNSRNLIGGGARFATQRKGFLGLGAFYFEERLDQTTNPAEALKDSGLRLNAYLSREYTYEDTTIFTARLYAQPRANALDDVRILFNASLKVAITPNASIAIGLKSTHDSEPATDVEKTNTSYTSGFEYRF